MFHTRKPLQSCLQLVDINVIGFSLVSFSIFNLDESFLAQSQVLFQMVIDINQSKSQFKQIVLANLVLPQFIDYFVHFRIQVSKLCNCAI
jgi:hypothetical protein